MRIEILETFCISIFSNASVETKMLMVNPIPASNPPTKSILKETFFGSVASFSLCKIKHIITMPKGLPITNPAIIPMLSL